MQAKIEKLYTVSKNKTGSNCGSDHELLVAKFRLKLKKGGKITRAFRYDLNQIHYNYTVEVTKRFMGLELWMDVHNILQEAVVKTIPKKKKCKNAKWLSEEALQIAEKRREAKGKGKKERYIHLNAEFLRLARRDSSVINAKKKIEESNRMGNTRVLFKKIRDAKGAFHAKIGPIKDRNSVDLTEAEDIKKRCQEY